MLRPKTLKQRLLRRVPQLFKPRLRRDGTDVLVLCGEDEPSEITREIMHTLFPSANTRSWNFVLSGFYGRHCRGDFWNPTWFARCFGNARFGIVVEEACDAAGTSDVRSALERRVSEYLAPGGAYITTSFRRRPGARIPGLVLEAAYPLPRSPVYVLVYRRNDA